MADEALQQQRIQILSTVVTTLIDDLKKGTGDKDRRRQVEEWMRTLAEKYPEFKIEVGLRDYYLAEAERLRDDFARAADLTEKLSLGRSIESFLDRAAEYDRRSSDLSSSYYPETKACASKTDPAVLGSSWAAKSPAGAGLHRLPDSRSYACISAISSCLRSASSLPTASRSILVDWSSGKSSSSSSLMCCLTISPRTRILAS